MSELIHNTFNFDLQTPANHTVVGFCRVSPTAEVLGGSAQVLLLEPAAHPVIGGRIDDALRVLHRQQHCLLHDLVILVVLILLPVCISHVLGIGGRLTELVLAVSEFWQDLPGF